MDYKFETTMQQLKYSVLKEAATLGFKGTINTVDRDQIAESIIPGPKPSFRCCIYKERNIIKERLSHALNEKDKDRVIRVIEAACDQCPMNRFTVTDACRGCIARSCEHACPVDAISICAGKAYINQEKCIECGRCKEACQFNAISDVQRPCVRSCPVDAIDMDENKVASIDYKECISCGQCAYNCPFGAITDITYIHEVAQSLSQKENKVYALVAPAIASQFDNTTIGQVTHALKAIGFSDVIEVALGADMVIKHETDEYIEHTKENSYMTTSCCPAFANIIKTKFPDQSGNMSTTVSPMIALGRLVKQLHPDAKTVFIGPCMAKKEEALNPSVVDAIDYVLTFEELRALLGAKEIRIDEMPVDPLNNASFLGRMFAVHGGVSTSIQGYIHHSNLNTEFTPVAANGAKECIKYLTLAKNNKLPGTFLEGMACNGGCISGPGSLNHRRKDVVSIKKYANLAKEKTPNDSLSVINLDDIKMHR